MASQGLRPLSPTEGAALVGRVLDAAPVQAAAMHFDADQWCASHSAAARSRFFAGLLRQSAASSRGDRDVASRLRLLEGQELQAALTECLVQQVAAVLRLDAARIPADKALRSLGLDSLMALELRNRLERTLGLKFSATLVWNYPTVAAMASHLAGRIAVQPHAEPKAGEASALAPRTKPLPAKDAEDGSRSAADMLEMELLGAESLLRN
jgi:acyl carrier protein